MPSFKGNSQNFRSSEFTLQPKIDTQWHVAVAKATGPARHGGLRKRDIILSIDGTTITMASQLKNYLIEHTKPGQRITIHVLRGEQEKVLHVVLGKSS